MDGRTHSRERRCIRDPYGMAIRSRSVVPRASFKKRTSSDSVATRCRRSSSRRASAKLTKTSTRADDDLKRALFDADDSARFAVALDVQRPDDVDVGAPRK